MNGVLQPILRSYQAKQHIGEVSGRMKLPHDMGRSQTPNLLLTNPACYLWTKHGAQVLGKKIFKEIFMKNKENLQNLHLLNNYICLIHFCLPFFLSILVTFYNSLICNIITQYALNSATSPKPA
jgi:hypothetical protein